MLLFVRENYVRSGALGPTGQFALKRAQADYANVPESASMVSLAWKDVRESEWTKMCAISR